MTAYVLFDVREVRDVAKLEAYRAAVLTTVEQHGGRYVIVGGQCEVLEGNWQPVFPVMIRFPSLEQARRWYDSEGYRALKALRLEATLCNAVVMESTTSPFISEE